MAIESAKITPVKIGAELPADTVKRGGGIAKQYEPALAEVAKAKGEWFMLKTFEKRNSAKGRANALAKLHPKFDFQVVSPEGSDGPHNLYARAK